MVAGSDAPEAEPGRATSRSGRAVQQGDRAMTMGLRVALVAILLGAGAAYAQTSESGSAGKPAPDVQRSGVVNERSAERPFDEQNPNPNYSNTEKPVKVEPGHNPDLKPGPNVRNDGAASSGSSRERETKTR
jgi:hypothetical protein